MTTAKAAPLSGKVCSFRHFEFNQSEAILAIGGIFLVSQEGSLSLSLSLSLMDTST